MSLSQIQDLERTIIVTAMLKQDSLPVVMRLRDDDFSLPFHRIVFKHIKTMYDAGSAGDIAAIHARMWDNGDLATQQNQSLWADLVKERSTYNPEELATVLIATSSRRGLYEMAEKVASMCKRPLVDIDEIIGYVDGCITTIGDTRIVHPEAVSDIANRGVDNLVLKDYITTGLDSIDHIIHGLYGGQLIVVGSRPGIGKSALVLQIAEHIAKHTKNAILFFSLEMPKKQIVRRLVTRHTAIGSDRIITGRISDSDRTKIIAALDSINKMGNLYIIDDVFSFHRIVRYIKEFSHRHPIGCVCLDYLQQCEATIGEQRYLQIGEMTRTLKKLSIQMDIPIVVLSQMSRTLDKSKRPELSDLRESGNIEQDADVVIFLHAKEKNNPKMELHVAKNRDGRVGFTDVYFRTGDLSFSSASDIEEETIWDGTKTHQSTTTKKQREQYPQASSKCEDKGLFSKNP